jgi:DNA-binding response OmpR family regulator
VAKVLVVEDTAEMRMLLAATLEQAGFEVAVAADGAEIMLATLECAPDVILLDILMPEIDGWEALRRLKADRRTAQIPVVIVSALGADEDLVHAHRVGAFDYVIKPWSEGELSERVRWAMVASKPA